MKKFLSGKISKIIFESNSGPYKVGLFKVEETNDEELNIYVNKVICFTGSFNDLNLDSEYIFYGDMIEHPKYGTQYNVSTYEIKVPTDKEGIILYLSSGMFHGIGKKIAKRIVDMYGSDTIDIIKNHYELLADINGVSFEKAKYMHDKVVNSEINQDLIIKLNGYGFNLKEAIELIAVYGSELEDIIEGDIYELLDVVSFNKLDSIFLTLHEDNHPYRVEALMKHNLYNLCYESGDSIIEREELFIKMKRSFNEDFSSDNFIVYLNKLIDKGDIVEVNGYITLYEFYDAEKYILNNINRINDIKDIVDNDKLDEYIKGYEKAYNIKFGKEQKEAIEGAIKNNFYIITGGPGTGKTTIIRAIVEILENMFKINKGNIALLAPTGRSAKRMNESVGASAYTIHKFLKWNKENKTFQIDEENKAKESVIIVDEASMIDIFLFSSLLKGLRFNVKLLLIGDVNQLPSIGPGDVLNDLLNMKSVKSKMLNTIYRVKEGSYITYLAQDIKNRVNFEKFDSYDDFSFIESSDEYIPIYLEKICEMVKEKNISLDSFQVLAPMYKGMCGIDNLNSKMAQIFNGDNYPFQIGDKYFRVNDKVLQLVNDVENNVYNGDIGYIKSISKSDNGLVVKIDFMGNIVEYKNGDFDKFALAYAISIHKSQGSEYDNVVVVLAKGFKRMFYNKLIYTAVTRAKSSLILIGSYDALNSSVQTMYSSLRKTYMKNV